MPDPPTVATGPDLLHVMQRARGPECSISGGAGDRLTPVSGSATCGHGDRRRSRRHARGRVHGPAGRRGRGPADARGPGPASCCSRSATAGSAAPTCTSSLEWGGRAGRDRGPRVLGHRRRARRRRDRLGGRRPGRRRARRRKCGECEYCLAGRPSLCVERGRVGAGDERRGRARSRGTRPCRRPRRCAFPTACRSSTPRSTEPLAVALHGITQGGGARPGHALARDRRRPDRLPVGRGAEGAGRRRHRRERAARRAAARCARSSARARSTPDELDDAAMAARHRRRAVRRRARVLGQRHARRKPRSRS